MTGSCEVRESSDDAAPLPVWSAQTFDYFLLQHSTFPILTFILSHLIDYYSILSSATPISHSNKHPVSYLQCDHERPRRCDRPDSQAGNSQDNTGQTLDRCAP